MLAYLGGAPRDRLALDQRLLEGYWLREDGGKAARLLDRMLAVADAGAPAGLGDGVYGLTPARYAWQCRADGRPERGREVIDRFLAKPEVSRPEAVTIRQRLLVERVRCSAAMRRWSDAAADATAALAALPKGDTTFDVFMHAHVIRGLAREAEGDAAGARAAFEEAAFRRWYSGPPDQADRAEAAASLEERMKAIMADALAGTLTEAKVRAVRDSMLDRAPASVRAVLRFRPTLVELVTLSPAEYAALARTPEALAVARHHVLQDVPFRRLYTDPVGLLATETVFGKVRPDALSAVDRAIVRRAADQLVTAFLLEQVGLGDAMSCATFWTGITSADPTQKLPPDLRPGVAYTLGLLVEHPKPGTANPEKAAATQGSSLLGSLGSGLGGKIGRFFGL